MKTGDLSNNGTIEHCAPAGKRDYVSAQHIERYRFAISRLKPGMKVLDVASGNGYGTTLLMKYGCDVVGAEYDMDTLKGARQLWGHDGFVHADALDLPFKSGTFDAVVSFETIEHVHDGRKFLSEMRRVLSPGGTFICSTPNIAYTAHPHYHIKEYKPEEFYELVGKQFIIIKRFGQYINLIDRINDLYLWHVRSKIIKFLDIIRVKKLLKSMIFRKAAEAPHSFDGDGWAEKVLNETSNMDYSVLPFNDTGMLRIMIIVARKG